jgi:hypothetical protein
MHGTNSLAMKNQSLILKAQKKETFHGAFGADPSDVHDWLNKDVEDFGYQNLTEEEIARQGEEDNTSEEDDEVEEKEET